MCSILKDGDLYKATRDHRLTLYLIYVQKSVTGVKKYFALRIKMQLTNSTSCKPKRNRWDRLCYCALMLRAYI